MKLGAEGPSTTKIGGPSAAATLFLAEQGSAPAERRSALRIGSRPRRAAFSPCRAAHTPPYRYRRLGSRG